MSRERAFSSNAPILPLISALFFVLTFFLKAVTDGPYMRGEISADVAYLKYATAAISCVTALIHAIGEGEHNFVREFNMLSMLTVFFVLASAILQAVHGSLDSAVWVELVKLYMPMVLAYSLLNALHRRQINACMIVVLVISIAGYALELRSNDASIFSIFQADYSTSTSGTESSGFAETFLMLTFYFAFARTSNAALAISGLFCFLTFKRLAMVVCVVVVLLALFAPNLMRRTVPKWLKYACIALTLCATALWFWLLLPSQERLFYELFGAFPGSFTSGRSETMRYLLNSGFESYGFGSANDVIKSIYGAPFEMDLIKIAFELTPIATVVFVAVFWNLAGSTPWGYLIIAYFILNMISSDSLTANFSFSLAYIVIGLVGSDNAVRARVVDSRVAAYGER